MSSVLKKYKGNVVNYKQFEEIIKYFDKQPKPTQEEVGDLSTLSSISIIDCRYRRVWPCLTLMARVGCHEVR